MQSVNCAPSRPNIGWPRTEEAGIAYWILGPITTLVNHVDPRLKDWVKIQVARVREEEARELLANLEDLLHT